jgi:hypothetical protein
VEAAARIVAVDLIEELRGLRQAEAEASISEHRLRVEAQTASGHGFCKSSSPVVSVRAQFPMDMAELSVAHS